MQTTMDIPMVRAAQNQGFAHQSKVWIYTAQRPFNTEEEALVEEALARFSKDWTAHNQALKASGEVFAHQVIVLVVDERMAGASGCSIDKSVHFLEKLSAQLGIDLFDRMRFGWLDTSGNARFDSRDELSKLKAEGHIGENTLMFNSLAPTLGELREKAWQKLGDSWHKRLI
jgi:hypothetical protein